MLKPTLAAAAILTLAAGAAHADEPIRTLLLTGKNNHNWQYTSRVHAETLGDTGRFAVTISDDPAKALTTKADQPWQLFVIDYNDLDAPKRWGDAAEKAFVQAVNNGAGVVAVHASDNAFKGWTEYEQMLGLMWRDGSAHGKFHTFTVTAVDKADPIMAGLPEWFETTDELYHKLVNSQNARYHLLAQAMSEKESGGTGENEPMALTLTYGKGRIFATPLGHVWAGSDDQKTSITNPNFRLLLCRGAEWAATGNVTLGKEWKPVAADASANHLTDAEKAAGWTLLFDGKTSASWRGYKKTEFPKEGWSVANGILKHEGGKGGGDIVTGDEFDNFELMIDWRVAEGANSGVIYRCSEDHEYPWQTGPEMQILDDARHADGKKPKTRAGTFYDVAPCAFDVSRPAGEWNHARLVANGAKIQHWLNGFKVVDVDTSTDDFKKAVAASKWKDAKDYNSHAKGHIDLQDHGDTVEFRNIKVRRLGDPNPDKPTAQSRAVKAGNLTHGPFPGHSGPTDALVWARGAAPGAYRLWLSDAQGKLVATADAKATVDDDLCMTFSVGALVPGATYTARVAAVVNPSTAENPLPGAGECAVITAPEPTADAKTTIVFGSCTADPVDREQPIWRTVASTKPDAVCLIGDTPYIDTTDLTVQRAKYGNLFAVDELAALRKRGTIVYGVWDDHDFGKNDTDGRLAGKEHSRKAFLEYHANAGGTAGAGTGTEGVYSSFRRGPVEVFLLDARWFSNNQTLQLLGEQQWQWLLDGLHRSGAKYKLLVTGMVWNDATRPDKTDYWGHYPKERQRLVDAVRNDKIPGVIFVGGDIHRSRAFRTHPFFATSPSHESRAGAIPYTIHEWVSSPLGNSVHEAWNVPGESLVFDEGNPHAFLAVSADAESITARWLDAGGREMYKVRVPAADLTVPSAGEPLKPSAAAVPAARDQGLQQCHAAIVAAFAPPTPPPADRHAPQPALNAGRLVFLGDSITEGWAGAGEQEWGRRFAARGAVNAGIGGDRTEHVLWRLDNGLLESMRNSKTKLVVLMIGTNNSNGGDHNAAEIAEGVTAIVDRLTTQAGDTKVLLLGVFPRSPKVDFQRRKVAEVNKLIAKLDGSMSGRVKYLNIGDKFLDEKGWEGSLPPDIMPDFLHLSGKGYTIWADAVEPVIAEMLGEK